MIDEQAGRRLRGFAKPRDTSIYARIALSSAGAVIFWQHIRTLYAAQQVMGIIPARLSVNSLLCSSQQRGFGFYLDMDKWLCVAPELTVLVQDRKSVV